MKLTALLLGAALLIAGCAARQIAVTDDPLGVPRDTYGQAVLD